MTELSQSSERALLSDALGIDPASMTLHSREPLGAGSVTGFHVAGAQPLLYFVDTSQIAVAHETGWMIPGARIWMHPADPHLPALAPIAFDHGAETVLARMGFASSGAPQMVAYRPGRRAVLRVPTDQSVVWMKVTRPSRVQTLVGAQTAAADADVPVPNMHGWSPEGLVVMADAEGTPAADVAWNPERLLDEVDSLRARIAGVPWERRVQGAARRIPWYYSRADAGAAAALERARKLIDEFSGNRPHTVVHGDLHFGQLFLDGLGSIHSVIDVDTLGIADPAEDSAAFIAHAVVSAGLTGDMNSSRVWMLADAAVDRWGGDLLVRALTAVHLVGYSIAAVDRDDTAAAGQSLTAADAVLRGEMPSGVV